MVCDNCQIRELTLLGTACVASVQIEAVDGIPPIFATADGGTSAQETTRPRPSLSPSHKPSPSLTPSPIHEPHPNSNPSPNPTQETVNFGDTPLNTVAEKVARRS